MFNLVSLQMAHGYKQESHRYRYLIEQGCKDLIKGLNGAIFQTLAKQWVDNVESTLKKFANMKH